MAEMIEIEATRAFSFPPIVERDDEAGPVRTLFPELHLNRGRNRVARVHWESLLATRPAVETRLELGHLEVVEPSAAPEGPELPEVLVPLVDLTVAKAKTVIEMAEDHGMLSAWRAYEAAREAPRSGLLELLDKRLEDLVAELP